jgi:hypothetical protein
MAKKEAYPVRTRVVMIRGMYKGERGIIVAIRGLFTKTYDIALFDVEGAVLPKRPVTDFTLEKR